MDMDHFHNLWPVRNRQNHFATVSLWCGIIGIISATMPYGMLLTPFIFIAGVLSGVIALVLFCRPRSRYEGIKRALAGVLICMAAFYLLGIFWTSLRNYAQVPQCRMKVREISASLDLYVKAHHGRYPVSLDELGLPPEKLYCTKYSFFHFHSKSPYLLNGYLAGKVPGRLKHPESTILLAEGRESSRKLFYSLADMDLTVHCAVAFVGGGGSDHFYREDIPAHFPAGGADTKDTWYIQPVLQQ